MSRQGTEIRIRFREGSRTIEGYGKALLLAQLPTGSHSHLKLQSTCYVPNSTLTLISVPCLDDVDCYTLFGNGRCVTFENQDDGKLLQESMTKGKVIFTATKGADRLYHLDTPHQSKEFLYFLPNPLCLSSSNYITHLATSTIRLSKSWFEKG